MDLIIRLADDSLMREPCASGLNPVLVITITGFSDHYYR